MVKGRSSSFKSSSRSRGKGESGAAKQRKKRSQERQTAEVLKRNKTSRRKHSTDFSDRRTPAQTPEQRATAEAHAEDVRKRGGGPVGPGGTYVPPRAPLTVETRRVGTREEVQALEDRPGVTSPELTPEVFEDRGSLMVSDEEATNLSEREISALGTKRAILTGAKIGVAAAATYVVGAAALKLIATNGLTGAGVLKTAGGQVVRLSKFGRIITGTSARAATRGTTFARIGEVVKPGTVTVNTKNAGRVMSYLKKMITPTTVGYGALGLLTTGLYTSFFWAPNEKGDAMTTLTIAQKEAFRAEDFQGVLEIGKMMKEADEIAASIPVVGFTQAELAKFKASIKASEVYTNQAKKQLAESETK